jgi:hypothetical protein
MKRIQFILLIYLTVMVANRLGHAEEVGIWKRYEISIKNPTWTGNPFDVELKGKFTGPQRREVEHRGFYAGDNTWKIYFMPDVVGEWTYSTESPDSELDSSQRAFQCIPSGLQGQLMATGNRWQLSEAGGDVPVIWNPPVPDGNHWGFRARALSDKSIRDAIELADEVVKARVISIGELLVIPTSWAKDWPQDSVPYVQGQEGTAFHFTFWDRLNAKLDALRDRGLGHYIMFYSDDALVPDRYGLKPKSPEELRFFRYAVARLACYPIVLWDTGIDIGEYRDRAWIDWFAVWFKTHDPWHHPVSSRSGGGSGGSLPKQASYFSTGGAGIPSRAELLNLLQRPIPTVHTDHWRPFISRGDWTHDKIRTVQWRCALSGGQASFPDYNQGTVKFDQVATGARYIGFAAHFFRNELRGDVGDLVPHDELIVSGEYAILSAQTGSEYVVYDEDGGSVTVDLTGTPGQLKARWYNPRTGKISGETKTSGGKQQSFQSPTRGKNHDWVLHIYREQ